MTKINNLDHAIEISIKKYLYSQIFKKGTQKIPALVPHPRVFNFMYVIVLYIIYIVCFQFLLTMGCVLSLSFSRSPWSKNSSATRLAKRCCCSQGLAIALTSQAVISIPHRTAKKIKRYKVFIQYNKIY